MKFDQPASTNPIDHLKVIGKPVERIDGALKVTEVDATMSPMKAKGVGELGISGVAAAIANAVHHATGVRVRSYPITLDKLLEHLPPV